MKPLRILIVDDSAFIRKTLARVINDDPDLEVVGAAENGKQAVELAEQLRPDFITLDIKMPVMDGLEALKIIMERCPTRVLMISTLTTEGAEATFDALALGAVDFISKQWGEATFVFRDLKEHVIQKIKEIAYKHPVPAGPAVPSPERVPLAGRAEVVAIGASTGGPQAITELLAAMGPAFTAAGLIVQHMPTNFLPVFAERLNRRTGLPVKLAESGEALVPGAFLVAPGRTHMKLRRAKGYGATVWLDPEPAALHVPSVNQLFVHTALCYPGAALGVIMTGMGNDGQEGAARMKEAGNAVLAQDEESCVVWGMPRAVVLAKLADAVLPLGRMHDYILRSQR